MPFLPPNQQRQSTEGKSMSQYQKGKTNQDLLEQDTVSGSGISRAICKSASRSRQITTPAPRHWNTKAWITTHTHTHNHFTALLEFVQDTQVSRYQKGKTRKVKTNLDLLEQEIVSGSGICWAIRKSAPHPRQPCQHPTTQFFTGRMPFLPPNQQHQSTEGCVHNYKQRTNTHTTNFQC